MIRLETGPAFFYYVKNGRLAGMLALHVDDALYGGSPSSYKDVITPMMAGFNCERRMEEEYRIQLGMWNNTKATSM